MSAIPKKIIKRNTKLILEEESEKGEESESEREEENEEGQESEGEEESELEDELEYELEYELKDKNKQTWVEGDDQYKYLYPNLNDPLFNTKIAEKKEFNDARYDGKIHEINKQAEILCNADFELSPHQQFIRNFLSFQTPYNSLLLYHGLGSGKTCSAIGVAEEMRDYMNQIGTSQRIIIVASPNVQDNFRLQLFDESKLKLVDGLWSIKSCTGNKFLKEINPMGMKGLTKEKIVSQIKQLINSSYLFLGYIEFANYISKKANITGESKNKDLSISNKLKKVFRNRLIIIDEVHNIRITDDNKDKRVAQELFKLVKTVDNLRFLFLSATPLYNNYKEIIWLINIMNLNDRRGTIEVKDVFDSNGNFRINEAGDEIGKELLMRKATGYISYVRGDNPYTFPYRIWPNEFAPEKAIREIVYPLIQLNGKRIVNQIEYISLYITHLGEYQSRGYNYILNKIKENELSKSETIFENMDSLGYILLQRPIEALNIIYPNTNLDVDVGIEINTSVKELVGKSGLNNIMSYTESNNPPSRTNFEYKDTKYGHIFSPNEIGKYSSKIKEICNNILNSDGVILIYSQYLDGGLVPIALALEEMGITRHGSVKSLFKTPPITNLDLMTYKNEKSKNSISAKYVMITGDKMLSPNTKNDIMACTQDDNVNGHKVKVVLISQTGTEGLDLKFIRQVHILEPWYNMSRIEQIIGRAVRNCSHIRLPYEKRNVEIFLYGSILDDEQEEAADLYIYRLAEIKALQIGKINRVLKEVSVDCLLNSEQLNFTSENMNQSVIQVLSNYKQINYSVGDRPYSFQCDYMDSCLYKCKPNDTIGEINMLTYSENFIEINATKIINRIKQLMKEKFFYEKNTLIKEITVVKSYPLIQIYAALNHLVTDKNEYITDKYGRLGNLINIGNYYLFQPIELTDENISIYDRKVPIMFKHDKITFRIPEESELPKELPNLPKETIKVDTKKHTLDNGKIILNNMLALYNISTDSKQIVERGEDNWYKFCFIIMNKLNKDGIDRELLEAFLISHIIEELLFDDLLSIINYIYNSKNILTEFEEKVKKYFENRELKNKGIMGIILHKDGTQKLIIQNNRNNIWNMAKPEDYSDLAPVIKEKIVPISSLNDLVGFMILFKKEFMIFKVKQLNKKRNKGARCDQATKSDTIKILNMIVDEKKYTTENTKGINQKQLCVLLEFMLRLYDYEEKDGKRWFLDPFESIITNIEKVEL